MLANHAATVELHTSGKSMGKYLRYPVLNDVVVFPFPLRHDVTTDVDPS